MLQYNTFYEHNICSKGKHYHLDVGPLSLYQLGDHLPQLLGVGELPAGGHLSTNQRSVSRSRDQY